MRRLLQEDWIEPGAQGRYTLTPNGRMALRCLVYLSDGARA
jgi:hypothetical protein